MKIGVIPTYSATGEHQYGNNLIQGLVNDNIKIKVLDNFFLKNVNCKMYIGSFLLDQLIDSDITHIHNLDNLGPFLFKFNHRKIKRILTVHDLAPIILPEIYNYKIRYDFQFCLPKMIKNCDTVISGSYATKNDLIKFFKINHKKIVVIPHGIDNAVFRPKEPNKEVLKKYNLQQNYILYVGSDNIRKNLKTLLLGFINLINKIPHDLVLVGPINPTFIHSILKNNKKFELLKRIKLLNFVGLDDLVNIYNGADLFVYPSLYEGFGFPPLEALACGVPVIVSDNSSLTEMMTDYGVYLKNPLNYKEISNSILNIIENTELSEKIKKDGPEYVKKFQWKNTIKKTIEIYNEI